MTHGAFKALLWRDAKLYEAWATGIVHADPVEKSIIPGNRGCPYDCGLCPEHEGGTCTAVLKGLIQQSSDGLEMVHFIPRKRFDAHCSFSSLFLLSKNNRLQAATRNEAEPRVVIQERMEAFRQNKKERDNRDYFTEGANFFTDKHWRLEEKREKGVWAAFERIRDYRLTISGMPFQDVWNLDLDRLKGCCVHVMGADKRMIPLCACYLTAADGRRLYGPGEEGGR
jgi:uncharacterized radical SAM superfamily Fe-S cluster-containing enzyme